jgi:hypothetical protein
MKHNQLGFITIPGFNRVKLYIFGVITVIAIAAISYAYFTYSQLELKAAKLEKDNSTLKASVETLTKTNEANVKIIEQLGKDKQYADKLVSDLRKEKLKIVTEMNKIRYSIHTRVAKDPSADGPIAPVLKDTILLLNKPATKTEKDKK